MPRFCTTDFTERVAGVHKSLRSDAQFLLILSVKRALCHASGAWNFEVVPTFFGKCMYIWLTLQSVLNQSESAFRPLACTREVSGSKLFGTPANPRFSMVFLSVSIQKSESYTELGNDYLFTYNFPLNNHHSSHNSTIFSSSY
jgi:hypothetical protein